MSSLEWQDLRHKVSEEHARIPGGRSPKTATIRITPTKSRNHKAPEQAKKVANVAEQRPLTSSYFYKFLPCPPQPSPTVLCSD